MGAAGTVAATSVTMSIGAVTWTESGYFPMATRSINCGEGSADVRAARMARQKGAYIMIVVLTRKETKTLEMFKKLNEGDDEIQQERLLSLPFHQILEKCGGRHDFISSSASGSISYSLAYRVYWPATISIVSNAVESLTGRKGRSSLPSGLSIRQIEAIG